MAIRSYIKEEALKKEIALKELDTELSQGHSLIDSSYSRITSSFKRQILENILEKTLIALRKGANKRDIEKIFVKYIPKYWPDRSYG